MAIVIRCQRCEKDHEINENDLKKQSLDCPFCNNSSPQEDYSAIMFCPHCYSELHVPLDVIHRELQCPFCDKVFRSNVSFSLSESDEEDEKIIEEHTPEEHISPGDVFDKYKIIRCIGKGGMGEVYLAQHMLLNREVALKILNSNISSSNQVYAKRFVREAKLANRVNSENFAEVYDAGIESRSGSLFIAMEYIDGCNLNEIVHKNGTFCELDILSIAHSIAEVLIILEKENIVHRDIKPSNIMINSDGIVKLTDFGIAKTENDDEANLTLTQGSMVFGTPNYASPEQCRSSHNVDFRSDIYSLGATMFHMAAGVPPYDGTTAMETVLKVLNEEPRDLSSLTEGFSAGFILLIKDMLKRDPEKRPPNAEVLKMRIESLLKGHQSFATRLKFASRIWISKLRLLASDTVDYLKKSMKKFPKKTLLSLTKKLILILIFFFGIVFTLRNRNVILKWYNSAKQFIVELSSPTEKKTKNNIETAVVEKKVEVPVKEPEKVAVKPEIQPPKQETPPPPPKKIVKKKKKQHGRRKISASSENIEQKVIKKKIDNIFYRDALRMAIFKRLEKCRKELRQVREARYSYPDYSWYNARIKFYKKLEKNLEKQLREREQAFNARTSKKFDKKITSSVAAIVYEYSKFEHKEPFNAEDKIFAQQLLHYLKDPACNPNILIKDARHPEFSGALLRWISHANMPMKKEIKKELMLHHVSSDCIHGNCSIELCKYGIISLKNMLSSAIKSKNFDNAITLINFGADVNEIDDDGRSPLHWAIMHNNKKLVRYLLVAGADVNIKEKKQQQTPLFYAEKYASREIRDLLLSLGADGKIKDSAGQPYQHYSFVREFNEAMNKNDFKSVSLFLANHTELNNMEMTGGMLPLQYSCMHNYTSISLELLKNKANPNAVSAVCPYTPLQLAYEYPENRKQADNARLIRWSVFSSLLQHGAEADVMPIGHNYPTLLQFSLADIEKLDERHMYFISSLISSYDTSKELVSLLYRMYNYKKPYYSKNKNDKRERILNQLLMKRPDLSNKKYDPIFPFIAWSPDISEKELDMLIKCKVNVNGKDRYGRNALYMLCVYITQNQSYIDGQSLPLMIQRVKYLLKKGVDKKCTVENFSMLDMELPELIKSLLK